MVLPRTANKTEQGVQWYCVTAELLLEWPDAWHLVSAASNVKMQKGMNMNVRMCVKRNMLQRLCARQRGPTSGSGKQADKKQAHCQLLAQRI